MWSPNVWANWFWLIQKHCCHASKKRWPAKVLSCVPQLFQLSNSPFPIIHNRSMRYCVNALASSCSHCKILSRRCAVSHWLLSIRLYTISPVWSEIYCLYYFLICIRKLRSRWVLIGHWDTVAGETIFIDHTLYCRKN